MRNYSVEIAGVRLKNPVMTCSGTFGVADELSEFTDISRIGAITTKGIAPVPWEGNKTPRVAEVEGGMLNAIGLQNAGVDRYIEKDVPVLEKLDTVVVTNVVGHTPEEYVEVVKKLRGIDAIKLLEINISCPNVSAGGASIGTDPHMAEKVTRMCREAADKPIIMKLSPNVTDITEIAKACEAGGADALSLINSITGMKIDVRKRAFALANKTGGLSGPAIKPVAVRMVYQCANAVSLPLVGMGGIFSGEDALEFIMAGATAVSVGLATFHDPDAPSRIVSEIEDYMEKYGIDDINSLRGCVK